MEAESMSAYRCVPRSYYKRYPCYQNDGLLIRAGLFNGETSSECWYIPALQDEVYVAKFVGHPGWHLASFNSVAVYDFFPKLKDALLYLRLVSC